MQKQIVLSAALLAGANAKMSLGKCPDVENMPSLDVAAYAGIWYETEKDPMFPMTIGSSCTFKEFTQDSNGDLELWFGAKYPMGMGYGGVDGVMYNCDGSTDETCEATMGGGSKRSPFGILATDYETYDIGYYCMDMIENVMKAEFVMVYSRTKEMSKETKKIVRDIINEKVPSYAYDW